MNINDIINTARKEIRALFGIGINRNIYKALSIIDNINNSDDDIIKFNELHRAIKEIYFTTIGVNAANLIKIQNVLKKIGYIPININNNDILNREYFDYIVPESNNEKSNTIKKIIIKPFKFVYNNIDYILCGKCTYYK